MTGETTGSKPRVAAIGDIHVEEDRHAPHRELFGEISRGAEILAESLRSCSLPVVAVLGNHD